MRSFSSLADYAAAFVGNLVGDLRGRVAVSIDGLRWRPHPGHTLIEYEFDPRIGYNVPVRELQHDGCIVDEGGRVYCPYCKTLITPVKVKRQT